MRLVVEQVVVGRRMEAVFEGQDQMTTWCFSIKDGVRMVELEEYLLFLGVLMTVVTHDIDKAVFGFPWVAVVDGT